jgi:hypothetical protein
MMKHLPDEITAARLSCIIMPNGKVLCLGKMVGWFDNLKGQLRCDPRAQ